LDIATIAHMTISGTKGDINKYPHYKQILFTFVEVADIAISNKQNWNYDRVIVREVVMKGKRVVRMMAMRVKRRGKRPNNIGNLKEGMTPHLTHNHKPNTHFLRRGFFIHTPNSF